MSDAVGSPALAVSSGNYKIRKAAWIVCAALGFLLAAVLVIPHFVDLALFKRTYLPTIEEALNRRIDIGEARLSLIPTPSIRVANLRVSDHLDGYAETNLFSAEQVQLRLQFWPLLKGRFEVSELVLEKPTVNFLRQADGTLTDPDRAAKKTPVSPRRDARKRPEGTKGTDTTMGPLLLPANLRVRDGQINFISRNQPPVNIRDIDLSLRGFSANAPFPFKASFSYPGLKAISLTGALRYREEKSLLELKNNTLKIDDLTLPLQGSIGSLSSTPRLNLDLTGSDVDAKPIFEILAIFGLAPRDTEVSGPMDLHVKFIGPSNSLVTHIQGLFKQVKVHGKRALRGTLTGEVSIGLPTGAGPASRRMQGTGKLIARDGELTNVNLIKKIERVTGAIGLSKDERRQATTFQIMEGEFTIGGGHAHFSRLYLMNPQMEVSGSGTMTIEQPTLNITLDTALSPRASARVSGARVTTFLKDRQGRIVVPLRVIGPVENPSVDLDSGKVAATGLPPRVEKGFGAFFKQLFRR
ncbi:MAG TPA: AsmA family protein [Candidatus Binatia bacterium]|nr:AsmA family protein [Candidatus Binatia bacterium]